MAELKTLGAYTILEHLRQGACTDTYLAEHTIMREQRVLLRVLRPDASPEYVEAFDRAARTAARLNHDGIAGVIDLKHPKGQTYAVLEYVDGLDLPQLRERLGAPPVEVVTAIARDVFRALEHAHAAGVFHRRLRPRMIKLNAEGRVKILGFGVESDRALDSDGGEANDALYRAPEQVRAQPEDDGVDLYSSGVVLYELLAGRLPFDAPPPPRPSPSRAPRLAPPLHDANPLVPAALAAIVEGLLAESRGARPPSAAVVRLELEGVLEEMGVPSGPDLVRDFVADAPSVARRTRQRGLDRLFRQAERLAAGQSRDEAAARRELERLLAIEPEHAAAKSLLRRLGPAPEPPAASVPDPADATMILPPAPGVPASADATLMMPPAASVPEPADATMILPPGGPPAAPPAPADSTVLLPPEPQMRPTPRPTPRPAPAPAPAPEPVAARPSRPAPRPTPASPVSSRRPAWLVPLLGVLAVAIVVVVALIAWPRPHPTDARPGEESLASLDVSTTPASASITLVDRGETRTAPTTFERLAAGTARLRAELPGYLARETTLTVTAGRTLAVAIALSPESSAVAVPPPSPLPGAAACTLFVLTRPHADAVRIDGRPAVAHDSLFFAAVAPGRHRIEADAKDHQGGSLRVSARAGARNAYVMTLEPVARPAPAAPPPAPEPPPAAPVTPAPAANGPTVHIDARPRADVYVDGVLAQAGVTRGDITVAPDAKHTIELRNPDYGSYSQERSGKAGSKLNAVKFDFTVGSGGISVRASRSDVIVWVDGKSTGQSPPAVIRPLATGRHVVELREKDNTTVAGRKDVVVENSSINKPLQF